MPNIEDKLFNLLCESEYMDWDKKVEYLVANNVTVNEWISVKDMLPEEDGRYLVCKDLWGKSYISVVWFAKDGRKVSKYDFDNRWKNVWYEYDSEYGNITLDNVTHWIPTPQPPKGE